MAAASAAGSFRDRDLPNLGADSADQNWISVLVLVFKFNLNLLASGDINGKVISPAYRSLMQVNTKTRHVNHHRSHAPHHSGTNHLLTSAGHPEKVLC